MKMTATQKIFARHAGRESVAAGELITADVDLVLGNDITSPVAIAEMKKAGDRVKYPEKVVLVLDHFVPAKDIKSAEQCKIVRDFAREQGIKHFYDVGCSGVEHALLPELGLIRPGSLVIGADSHTCTYGALGCVSTGVGSTDMAAAMLTGKLWFRVPSAIKVVLGGALPRFVTGKDVVLTLIGMLGVDGATYKSLEFFGDIAALTANLAKDDIVTPDEDAEYERTVTLDLNSVRPTVAFPHLPSNVRSFGKDVPEGLKIDQVVIGSCTNGRISDMRAAASVMKGRKVAEGVRCIVIPATQKVYMQCLEEGLIKIRGFDQDLHRERSRGVHADVRTLPRRIYGHPRRRRTRRRHHQPQFRGAHGRGFQRSLSRVPLRRGGERDKGRTCLPGGVI